MTPTTALGMSIRLSMFELRETGDWDIFLGGGGVQYLQVHCPKSLPVYGAGLRDIPSAEYLLIWDVLIRELSPRTRGWGLQ